MEEGEVRVPAPDNWPGSGSRSSSLPWSGPWHQGMSSLSRLQPLPDSVPSRSEGRATHGEVDAKSQLQLGWRVRGWPQQEGVWINMLLGVCFPGFSHRVNGGG